MKSAQMISVELAESNERRNRVFIRPIGAAKGTYAFRRERGQFFISIAIHRPASPSAVLETNDLILRIRGISLQQANRDLLLARLTPRNGRTGRASRVLLLWGRNQRYQKN